MQVVMFHANCMDGFAAATVCFSKYGMGAKYIPCQYGQKLQELLTKFSVGDTDPILMVDFSFPRDELEQLKNPTVILDHHKTAERALNGLNKPNIQIIFDMDRSGCVLTWMYLFPNCVAPILLQYIEDRDLWNWKLPNSKEINTALSTLDKEISRDCFAAWEVAVLNATQDLSGYYGRGRAILNYQNQLVEQAARNAKVVEITQVTAAGIKILTVLAVNSACLQSEIGHHLLETTTHDPVACYFHDLKSGDIIWSLRSKKGLARPAAEKWGGGGHDNAAGFRSSMLPKARI